MTCLWFGWKAGMAQVRMDLPINDMQMTARRKVGRHWISGHSIFFDMLSLRCLLCIQVQMLRRQMNTSLECRGKFRLEIHI